MSWIATHANPLARPTPSFIVRAPIENVPVDPAWEQLWTRKVAAGEYELACLPFFAYGMAFGDLLQVDENDAFRVTGVARKSGNRVLRVAVVDRDETKRLHSELHALLSLLEYECEWYAEGYVAIHLSPHRDHQQLIENLQELGADVTFEVV